MKPLVNCLSILILAAPPFPATSYSIPSFQSLSGSNQVAHKIDEYGDLGFEDEIGRLYSALDILTKEPTSRLYIVTYGFPGTARRRALRARNYLVKAAGVEPNHIGTAVGGYSGKASLELWITPEGARAPVPNPGVTAVQEGTIVRKYDEYQLDLAWFPYQKEPERLDGLAAALQAAPDVRAYIVVHKGVGRCEYCLRPGAELGFAKGEKRYLVRRHHIDSSRVVVRKGHPIGGGVVEIWIVPRGALPPRSVISPRLRGNA